MLTDVDGFILEVNPNVCQMLGYTRSELLRMNTVNLLHPEDVRHSFLRVELLHAGGSLTLERRMRCKDGSFIVVEGRGRRLKNNQSMVILRDITERRRLEDDLRQSEERFRAIFESGIIGVVTGNVDGVIVEANDEYLRITGYTREDVLSGRLSWRESSPPEYDEADRRAFEEMNLTGRCNPYEKELIRKDGTRIPVLVGGTVRVNSVEGVACVIDISARKQAERALLVEQARRASST